MLPVPAGLDIYTPAPADNRPSAQKIELGRKLFSDRRLSADGSLACSSCHMPERAFSEPRPVAIGINGRRGTRNAPALINRAWGQSFFWDGRTKTLEEQVLRPIEDPNELGSTAISAANRVGRVSRTSARASQISPMRSRAMCDPSAQATRRSTAMSEATRRRLPRTSERGSLSFAEKACASAATSGLRSVTSSFTTQE